MTYSTSCHTKTQQLKRTPFASAYCVRPRSARRQQMTQGLRQAWIARASQKITLDVLWYVQTCVSDSPNLQSTRYTILLRLPPSSRTAPTPSLGPLHDCCIVLQKHDTLWMYARIRILGPTHRVVPRSRIIHFPRYGNVRAYCIKGRVQIARAHTNKTRHCCRAIHPTTGIMCRAAHLMHTFDEIYTLRK